jgi:uncharacterized repeat protein (TIGR01451 family)
MVMVLGMASLACVPQHTRAEVEGPMAAMTSTTLVISEVQVDALQGGTDSAYEWFELYNQSTSPVTLNNWRLGDNSASVRAFTTTIPARSAVIIAAELVSFTENFPSVACPVVDLGANIGNGFSNTGDRLLITDSVGSLVDAISYGSNTTILSPAISITGSVGGNSLERITLPDSDTNADWRVQQTPTPCLVPFTADLWVSKTGPSVSLVNMPITYQIGFSNIGTVFSATNVFVTDTLPVGLSYLSDTSGLLPVIAGQEVRWNVGALDAGASISFSLVVSPAGAGTYTNTLVGTADGESNLSNNTASAPTLVTTPTDLAITKTGPMTYTPGSLLVYTLTLSNASSVLAEGVTISDVLPANTSFVSDTSGLSAVTAGSVITWNVGAMSAGSAISFTLTVSASASWRGPLTNEAHAASSTADLNPINNTSRTTATTTPVRIREIQGAAHLSPLRGQSVFGVPGIVTAKRFNGFFLQDPNPDADDATSEGIFVFTSVTPTVSVGDSVIVSGTATEFRPGGNSGDNLTTSEITGPTVQVISSSNALPATTIIGLGGRVPPANVIDNDALSGTTEFTGTLFDAAEDGIDFYESLEGMLVQVNNAVATGPTTANSAFDDETPVLADLGMSATVRTPRGGIVIRPDDFNPERVILNGDLLGNNLPDMRVGDNVTAPITGVMDYSFGNFKLLVAAPFTITAGGLTREVTTAAITHEVSIATFNVENLSAADSADKFNGLAAVVVNNLRSPDIVALEEMQDNNGATNDTQVDASQTYSTFITAIVAAGGPAYQYRQIDPVDDADGGEPGGNIRVGFLFRVDRGLSFVDRPGGTAISETQVISVGGQLQLSASPGRISPNDAYYIGSRKPLVGEFLFEGKTLFVIANHFRSKGGDDPLFGRWQPPMRGSEMTRTGQALLVQAFVSQALALDPKANIVVLGDINDFQFSSTMAALKGTNLTVLMDTLPEGERYTYIFEGNAQSLDHMLLSRNLMEVAEPAYDIVHVNAEFTPSTRTSDHDPQVVRLYLGPKRFKIFLPVVQK